MEPVLFTLIGLLIGWFAGVLLKEHSINKFYDIIIGIVSALLSGYIFNLTGLNRFGLNGSMIVAALGAASVSLLRRFYIT